MNTASNPIMDEIYAIRHDFSVSCGHDASAYFSIVQNEKQEARNLGLSYFDYCLARLNQEGPSTASLRV